jgi:hypothetical protein
MLEKEETLKYTHNSSIKDGIRIGSLCEELVSV